MVSIVWNFRGSMSTLGRSGGPLVSVMTVVEFHSVTGDIQDYHVTNEQFQRIF